MKSYEMVETLSTRAHVTLEQAKEALEQSNWDILDAAIYIERNRARMDQQQTSAPNTAYYVSGFQREDHGAYATPGFGRPGPFDPRVDFNRPHGGFVPPPPPPPGNFPPPGGYRGQGATMPPPPPGMPPVPPYKDFPNRGGQTPPPGFTPPSPGQGANAYSQPSQAGATAGEYIGKAAGMIENLVNAVFSTSFIVSRHDSIIFSMPLIVLIILFVPCLWMIIPIMVLGLAFDCKYSVGPKPPVTGQTPLSDFVDRTVNTALDTAQRAKDSIVKETSGVRATYEHSKAEFAEDYWRGKESVSGQKIDLTKPPQ